MNSAEVRLLSASLRNSETPEGAKAVAADLERALALDPKSAEAFRSRAEWHWQREELALAEKDFRRANELAPNEPRYTASLAQFLLLRELPESRDGHFTPELDALMARLVREAKTAAQLNLAARYMLIRSRPEAAMRLVRRALVLDSSCWRCFETLADAAATKDHWKLAVRSMRIAAHGRPSHSASRQGLAKLAEYEKRLAARAQSNEGATSDDGAGGE